MPLVSAMPRESSQTSPRGIIQKQVLTRNTLNFGPPKNFDDKKNMVRKKREPVFGALLKLITIPLRLAAQASKVARIAKVAHAVKTVGGKPLN